MPLHHKKVHEGTRENKQEGECGEKVWLVKGEGVPCDKRRDDDCGDEIFFLKAVHNYCVMGNVRSGTLRRFWTASVPGIVVLLNVATIVR